MTLNVRVLAPDQSVFDGTADELILPGTNGQIGILTGHVSILTALDTGVMRLRDGNSWQSIALLGGFAEVDSNNVTVLVNGGELGTTIDPATAEKELETARQTASALEGQPPTTEKVKAQQALSRARARFAASRST